MESFISPVIFESFTYSKLSHFLLFKSQHYDIELYDHEINPKSSTLKCWADMMVFSFIQQNIPPGSKILEVGGGDSRILRYFSKKQYECWNIDKLEGLGNGPKSLQNISYRFVQDYIGNFNQELPDAYFDFVFSISALEHTPPDDPVLFSNIFADLQRVLKPGGYSLHCFDIVIQNNKVWTNPLLPYLFEHVNTCNTFIPFETMQHDSDLFTLPEELYQKNWEPITKRAYREFGQPTSYNILWQKNN
jgi:ubiquinone/menaquinone biosynthesis C-methylase UbiE